jgi:segregation and condensation protein B
LSTTTSELQPLPVEEQKAEVEQSVDQQEEEGPKTLSKDAQARIEAALYAAGRPLTLEEISRAAKINSRRKLGILMLDLSKKINSTFAAIELKVVEGPMYSLQLKPEMNSVAKRFASKPLLSTSALRTLSYVVYLQPVSASELVLRRGSAVYSHLKDLAEIGFVRGERRGRGRVFSTTDNFADYFGLSHDADQQRKQVAKQGLITKAQRMEKEAQESKPAADNPESK